MSRACATFTRNAYTADLSRDLWVCTSFLAADTTEDHIQQVIDPSGSWALASGSRLPMETAIREALTTGSDYPVQAGEAMLKALSWSQGLEGLLQATPSSLKLTLDTETCSLLPELMPVHHDDGTSVWLDTVFPIHRTLYHVDQRQVERCPEMSLAIVYQDEEPFASLVREIRRALPRSLLVDTYQGTEFPGDPRGRVPLLQHVFYGHRAVLFLGHLHRPNGGTGGWQLAPQRWLPMEELHALLGGGRSPRSLQSSQRTGRGVCIPEMVFASCCCSAWGDPVTGDRRNIFYPELFLDAGVRFFVGTWMDVVLRSGNLEADCQIVQRLVSEFFARWSVSPNRTVEHLYEAKRQCNFHLLTSLYQIYAGVEQGADTGRKEPKSALVSGLIAGDRLGDYVLSSELWEDRYARTFWAQHAVSESPHLLQVLVDEWQDNRDLVSELEAAIRRLTEAGLSNGHLIPSRHEIVLWSRQGKELRRLHILVYDRPASEQVADWSSLASRPFERNQPDHFMKVLRLGAEISRLLWELHGKQILHGNLNPGSIVFLSVGGVEHAIIKDAWVKQTSSGRCTNPRYAAPEEPAQEEGPDRLKFDCWGLGVILFELTTGQPPFGEMESTSQGPRALIRDVMGSLQHRVPEALDRVVRECLMPSAAVRPGAEFVARRLLLALHAGGTYISDLEQGLEELIRAGQRLFAIRVDEMRALEAFLISLAAHPRANISYHLYEATENKGLIDRRSGELLLPWVSTQEFHDLIAAEAARNNLPTPRELTPDEVAALNGEGVLRWAAEMPPPPQGEVPILFIHGTDWWCAGPEGSQFLAWRLLKFCQNSRRFPVIIIADSFIRLEEDLARSFIVLDFPPLPPSELFERILASPRMEYLNVPDVTAETALKLASQLYPCSSRELSNAVRLCALQYGRIDERAVELRDQERVLAFRRFGTVTYTPHSKLLQPKFIGLPDSLQAVVNSWVQTTLAGLHPTEASTVPRRLMISGPDGYGKTSLAQTLAWQLQRPLIRIEATRCLRSGLSQSEGVLREALQAANALGGVLVLLEDIDRFFSVADIIDDTSSMAATMARMSAILFEWLNSMPQTVVTVSTCIAPQVLPAQWRLRIQLPLCLDDPTRLDQPTDASVAYRSAVFAALFRKFGLDDLSHDTTLMQDLAYETHPTLRIQPLLSPVARRCSGTSLGNHVTRLYTGADIEHWIAETLYLHGAQGQTGSPKTAHFWRNALQ